MHSVVTGPASVFCDAGAVLAESLVWDVREQELHWADITLGTLTSASASGEVLRVAELPPPLASFQPRASGGFVAALGDRIVTVAREGRITNEIASVRHATAGLRFNEGKVDPFGRFVVGSMNTTTDAPDAAVYSVSADGTVRTLCGGFGTTNGMEWSASGDTMYVTDTAVGTIFRGTYGPSGELGELTPFVVGAAHDGLTRDDEDCFWGAIYGGGRVERYSPTGALLEVVELPTANITSVAFGGPDLSTLFVATARENLAEEDLVAQPHAGAILAVPTRVHGFAPYEFAG